MKKNISIMLASWFGVGYLPFMPGTWGTLAAALCTSLGLYVFAPSYGQLHIAVALSVIALLLTGIGSWACLHIYKMNSDASAQNTHANKAHFDPSWIVIDEVAGYLTGVAIMAFALPLTGLHLLTLFAAFRVLDIQKTWPIGWVERYFGANPKLAPYGVMLDDSMAGILAGVIQLIIYKAI
jgi:phosphatidylglycerophosphatase A